VEFGAVDGSFLKRKEVLQLRRTSFLFKSDIRLSLDVTVSDFTTNMFTTPTILILGAGASVGYGFPTGGALKDRIAGLGGTITPRWAADDSHRSYISGAIHGFQYALRKSGHTLFDTFVEQHSRSQLAQSKRYAEMWSLLVAQEILDCENAYETEFNQYGEIRQPIKKRESWFEALYSRMWAGTSGWRDCMAKNNVWFWTLNYDRLLEYRFSEACLSECNSIDLGEFAQFCRNKIHHIHGTLGALYGDEQVKFGCQEGDSILIAASRLKAAHTVTNANLETLLWGPMQNFKDQEIQVAFLGFGFDRLNVAKMAFQEAKPLNLGISYHATVFGGATPRMTDVMRSIDRRMKTYGNIQELIESLPD
jgi:hypothetical protein